MPIMASLARAYGSHPGDASAKKMGAFLTLTAYQVNCITSAMFLTAMAANPLAQKLAGDLKVTITWGGWALAALVPGLVALILVPLLIYKLMRPEITETPEAVEMAKGHLRDLGPIKRQEWMMLGVFVMLLVLWTSSAALFGGMVAASIQLDISYGFFLETLPRVVPIANLYIGLGKGLAFGLVIALVACHFGLTVKPNTESLSANTTRSVVSAITCVILVDAVFAIATRHIGMPT